MSQNNIFISYARKDYDKIKGLLRCLKYYGMDLFLDQEAIEIGAEWREVLSTAIAKSNGAIVFFSEHSIGSKWVNWECEIFREIKKKNSAYKLLPIRLSECSIPEQISDLNHVDYFKQLSIIADELAQEIVGTLQGEYPKPYFNLHGHHSQNLLGINLERIILSLSLDVKANVHQRMFIEIARLLQHDRTQLRKVKRCNCGGDIVCGYVDAGGPDYYDYFFHICTTCYSCNHRSAYSSDFTDQEPGVCPFCQYKWFG